MSLGCVCVVAFPPVVLHGDAYGESACGPEIRPV